MQELFAVCSYIMFYRWQSFSISCYIIQVTLHTSVNNIDEMGHLGKHFLQQNISRNKLPVIWKSGWCMPSIRTCNTRYASCLYKQHWEFMKYLHELLHCGRNYRDKMHVALCALHHTLSRLVEEPINWAKSLDGHFHYIVKRSMYVQPTLQKNLHKSFEVRPCLLAKNGRCLLTHWTVV